MKLERTGQGDAERYAISDLTWTDLANVYDLVDCSEVSEFWALIRQAVHGEIDS